MAIIRNWTENRALRATATRIAKVQKLLEEISALWPEDNYVDTCCTDWSDELDALQAGIVEAAAERASVEGGA